MNRKFTLVPLTRPKGRTQINLENKPEGEIFKDRAERLIDALGGKWTRRHGYTLTHKNAEIFAALYKAGFNATSFGGVLTIDTKQFNKKAAIEYCRGL
jgi:adenosylmethionine-8-amino-7-oxononanoate aminotransferase